MYVCAVECVILNLVHNEVACSLCACTRVRACACSRRGLYNHPVYVIICAYAAACEISLNHSRVDINVKISNGHGHGIYIYHSPINVPINAL